MKRMLPCFSIFTLCALLGAGCDALFGGYSEDRTPPAEESPDLGGTPPDQGGAPPDLTQPPPQTCAGNACVTLAGVAPGKGPTRTPTSLTLTGTGFTHVSGLAVTVGGAPAGGVTVLSDTQLQASTPLASAPALADVGLSLLGGGPAVLPQAFRYYWGQVGLGPAATVAVPGSSYGVALADVNGDGHLDAIAVSTTAGTSGKVYVYPGDGKGGFGAGVGYPAGIDPLGLAVGDLNKDGYPDVVASDNGMAIVTVLINDRHGKFLAPVTYSNVGQSIGIVIADLDGDSNLDVATANVGGPGVGVFLGDGKGGLGKVAGYAAGKSPYGLAAADFNGDGLPDLVSNNGYYDDFRNVTVLTNTKGTFNKVDHYVTASTTSGVTTGDFNGDGHQDIAVIVNDGTLRVLPGDGHGSFGAAVNTNLHAPNQRMPAVAAVDLNRDGILDVVVMVPSGGARLPSTVQLLLGKGDGSFQLPGPTSAPDPSYWSVAAGDLDGDGRLDLVAAGGGPSFVTLLGTAN